MNATMIIECPSCGTKYKVIPEAIKPRGRTVHCTTCSNKWHVEPTHTEISDWEERFAPGSFTEDPADEPEPALDEPHHDEPVAVHEAGPAAPPLAPADAHEHESFMVATPRVASETEQGHAGRGASLGLLAASLALLAGGIFALHGQIERLWPVSARLYQAVGLEAGPAAGQGLAMQDVHAYLVQDGVRQTLNIEARVINPLKTPVSVPALDASLLSASGGPAQHWTVPAGTDRLEPGASTIIKASVDGANTENGKILLTFSADNSVESK